MDKSVLFLKALADETRLSIVKVLADGPKHVELMAEVTSLSAGTISFHLKKMEVVGLVSSKRDQYYRVYKLNQQLLDKTLAQIIGLKPKKEQLSAQEAYRKKVISSFIKHGQLQSIPVQKKKRLIVLEEIASKFKIDRDYPEKEINRILSNYHEDFCTLRRELVSSKLMERQSGIYRLKES